MPLRHQGQSGKDCCCVRKAQCEEIKMVEKQHDDYELVHTGRLNVFVFIWALAILALGIACVLLLVR